MDSLKHLIEAVNGSFPLTNIYDSKFISENVFRIMDDCYYDGHYLSRLKLPDIIYNYEIPPDGYENYDTIKFNISVETPIFESITFKFIRKSGSNTNFYVNLHNFKNIKSAKKIHLDFGNFNDYNVVNLNNSPRKDFLKITGSFVKVINIGYDSKSLFCVCKGDSCNQCIKDYVQLSYEDFCQRIHDDSDSKVEILIVGNGGNSSPVLNLDLLNNKDVSIVGVGQNPEIQIDCSKIYIGETNEINFRKIKIIPVSGDILQISNLNLDISCTLDSLFNKVSLKVNTLICNVSNLAFKSIHIDSYLTLYGDLESSISSTKVSFSEFSRFNAKLPSTIILNGPNLIFKNLEFDLSGTNPNFDTDDEITIIGQNGNIEPVAKNISFVNISQMKIEGTWENVKHRKFFYLTYDKNVSLSFKSENIPIVVEYPYSYRSFNTLNITLEGEKVSLFGDLYMCLDKSPQIYVGSIYNGRTSFYIEKLTYKGKYSDYSPYFNFTSSNIDMIIGTLETYGYDGTPFVSFNILVDLDNHDTVEIVNKIKSRWYQPSMYFEDDYYVALSYYIKLNVHSYPNDPNVIEFFNNNYTLIKVNEKDLISRDGKAFIFDTNMPNVFNENFLDYISYGTILKLECIEFPFGEYFEL